MADDIHLHVSLYEAWALWFRGKDLKVDGDVLWGLRMIWWGRIGVIVGFLGGLVILVDIIGPEKLADLGGRWWPKMERTFESARPGKKGGYRAFLLMFLSSPFVFGVAVGCAMLLSGFHGYTLSSRPGAIQLALSGVVKLCISVLFVAIFFCSLLSLWLFFSPLAVVIVKILNEDKGARYARIFALSMLVIAAHFALLTG